MNCLCEDDDMMQPIIMFRDGIRKVPDEQSILWFEPMTFTLLMFKWHTSNQGNAQPEESYKGEDMGRALLFSLISTRKWLQITTSTEESQCKKVWWDYKL